VVNVLETLPFDYGRKEAQELRNILAEAYYRDRDIEAVADAIRYPRSAIAFGVDAHSTWHEFLRDARARNVLRSLIEYVLSDSRALMYRDRVLELIRDDPIVAAPDSGFPGASDLLSTIREENYLTLEQITGDRPTFVDLYYLYAALAVAPAVVRIVSVFEDLVGYGSGFLISQDTVLTNFHVLHNTDGDCARARTTEVWFRYESDARGAQFDPIRIRGVVETIVGDYSPDWAVVRLTHPAPRDCVPLRLSSNAQVGVGDGLSIVQHPNGGRKCVAIQHNTVIHVDDGRLVYLTDTDSGSSGSPVFNDDWSVVGLHRGSDRVRTRIRKRVANIGVPIAVVASGLELAGVPFSSARMP
jgi:V8-like Glu-specific endopeptidase